MVSFELVPEHAIVFRCVTVPSARVSRGYTKTHEEPGSTPRRTREISLSEYSYDVFHRTNAEAKGFGGNQGHGYTLATGSLEYGTLSLGWFFDDVEKETK